ncbi:MAG TPA: hypothetical protein VIQ74_03830 [Gemmatimonadaceae bacterium]
MTTIQHRLRTECVRSRRYQAGVRWVLVLIGGTLGLTGCSNLLDVETPDIVVPDVLETPAGLEAQRRGAYGDFVLAFTGAANGGGPGIDGHISAVGLLTDELKSSTTQFDRTQLDAREGQDRNEVSRLYYANLQRARRAAESAALAYDAATEAPNRAIAQAEASALAGFTYVFFGEDFCAGVPFSSMADDGSIEFGMPTTTDEVLDLAIARFDAAIAHAQSASDIQHESLARVGKARALLDKGLYAEAAGVVAAVPTNFEYTIKYSTNTDRQVNELHNEVNIQQRLTAVNAEGGNGIAFFDRYDAGDPRVPYARDPDGKAFDASVEMFFQVKYPGRDTPVPLASGIEARLIEAEAALVGQPNEFGAIHDALRATVGLDPVDVGAMTADQRVNYHFEERATWLWLTGHRLGDMPRLISQYGRNAETVFPSGRYSRPQFVDYGTAVNLQIPVEERNNPNFAGCTSLGA